MIILDGKVARDFYAEKLKEKVSTLSHVPTLAIIQVGDNRESSAYIEQKKKFGMKIGIHVLILNFKDIVSFNEIASKVSELNEDTSIDGIIIQLPLPLHLEKMSVINLIKPEKDVDGLTDENRNKLAKGDSSGFVPATARGILSLLDFYKIPLTGKKIAMLGTSILVGAPTAQLLKNQGAHVTICDSKTKNTKEITKTSDIIIVAIGKARLIDATYIGTNMPIIVDVGINTIEGQKLEEEIKTRKIVGDVDFENVKNKVSAISPVPRGVGPMTVLSLCENVILASE